MDWEKTKEWGGGQERGEEILSFFLSLFPRLRRQIYSLGVGGGEHKEDRSAVLPSECLGT